MTNIATATVNSVLRSANLRGSLLWRAICNILLTTCRRNHNFQDKTACNMVANSQLSKHHVARTCHCVAPASPCCKNTEAVAVKATASNRSRIPDALRSALFVSAAMLTDFLGTRQLNCERGLGWLVSQMVPIRIMATPARPHRPGCSPKITNARSRLMIGLKLLSGP